MKKYKINDNELYIGETADIKALYKALYRAFEKGTSDLVPVFADRAKFSPMKQAYGLSITEDGYFSVMSADAALATIADMTE